MTSGVVQADLQVVGEAENGLRGIELARELKPDVVLMDVEMPVMNGVEAVCHLREQAVDTRIVMLTVSDADEHVFDAMRDGAQGYLLENLRPDQLFDMIRAIRRGETPISPAVAGRLLRDLLWGRAACRGPRRGV